MLREEPSRLQGEDDAARAHALDVGHSFLVQAPAGSGKTELLIQRYLALLARVEAPEQIVALTFTRKAAAEMRERVAQALRNAKQGCEPVEPHERTTHALARAALEQDARCGWAITEHASRMSMATFDALATELARRAPLAAGLGPHPEYIDDATSLFREAARNVIAAAGADDASLRTLLVHMDNNALRLANLVAVLLQRRDQWLRQVGVASRAELRAELEHALADEIVEVLGTTREAFPEGIGAEICARASDAAEALAGRDDPEELAAAVEACSGGLPEASVDALPRWRALARFLMVKSCKNFKKKVDEKDGFPAIGQGPAASQRRARKDAMLALCQTLNATPGLVDALVIAARLPDPTVGEASWRIVEALLDVLRRSAAELRTVFAARGRLDFLEANLAAVRALGDEDAPSDLLLRLDARVQHLLVDEFQDTSLVQLEVLRRLTAGWQRDDGRTLFAVGDPMQSIYRFREADVRFFIDAQRRCMIGEVPVDVLRLRRNFRSQRRLVDWSNDVFAAVLGETSDPVRGAVAFEPSVATREPIEASGATVDLCPSLRAEAVLVVERIRAAEAAGERTIAVLVRARNHLLEILPALRQAAIKFAAVELDRLTDRQAVIDLVALTHALTQPADRTAWLAMLRAPWCGLPLADLFAVAAAAGADRRAPLLPVLANVDAIADLSSEGRDRLAHVAGVLNAAIAARGRAGLADRVRGAWLALGGPAALDDPVDLDAASLYLDLLHANELGGDLPDRAALRSALEFLHATPGVDVGGVQVMTIHKAKGLQFDTVILPGLATEAKPPDRQLLRWRRRDRGLLIAPASGRGDEPDRLYEHLARLEQRADDAELGRLLYVACTRARNRLHLVGVDSVVTDEKTGVVEWKEPARSSSLRKLWPALSSFLSPPIEPQRPATATIVEPPMLARLPVDYRARIEADAILAPALCDARDVVTPTFDWARETARQIGTLAHRCLARIAEAGPQAWGPERVSALEDRVRAELEGAGFSHDELARAVRKTLDVVQRTLDDPRGRWLFDPGHGDARSEWALSGVDRGEIVRIVVDRTFIADGVRWIVDFKTGAHEGGEPTTFLDSEVVRYRDQLVRYGRMVRGLDRRPVRLALYYPLVDGGFREIDSAPQQLSIL